MNSLPLFRLITLISLPLISEQLKCYRCISPIDIEFLDGEERNAMKTALFTRYNLPKSHAECSTGGGSDLLFQTIQNEQCPSLNDTCVKFTSVSQLVTRKVPNYDSKHLSFTIRGCSSTLLKPGYQFSKDSSSSCKDCLYLCDTFLCNSSPSFPLLTAFFIILIINSL